MQLCCRPQNVPPTFLHPFTPPSIQRLFREQLLCAKSSSGHWRYNKDADSSLALEELIVWWGKTDETANGCNQTWKLAAQVK